MFVSPNFVLPLYRFLKQTKILFYYLIKLKK